MGKSLVRRLFTSAVLLAVVLGLVPAAAIATDYQSGATPTWIPNGQVWAMAVTPSRIYLGGDFTSLKNPATGSTVTRQHLAAIDRSTGNPTSWAPDVVGNPAEVDVNGNRTNPVVGALNVASDGSVFVGGDFNKVEGKTRNFIASVDKDGVVLDTFQPVVNGRVWDFARAGTNLYVVGQFGQVNTVTRHGAALLSTVDGSLITAWNADLGTDLSVTGGKAQAVAISGDTVFLGGTFEKIHGRTQRFLGSVNATTGADTTWAPLSQCENPDSICRVRDLAVDSTRLYAAIGGEPGGRAAAWNLGVLTPAPLWKSDTDGEVQAVTVYDGIVYFGGHFDLKVSEMDLTVDPPVIKKTTARRQFFAADPATGAVLPFKLPLASPSIPGLRAIHADSQGIRIAGETQITGKPYKNFITFAALGKTVPGPVEVTKVTVKTKGCKTCKVRLTENRGGGAAWSSGWEKGKKGTTHFTVPTSRTHGLTVQVEAPWEKKQKKTAEVVMRYKGQGVGDKVSAKEAQKAKKATSCYAGTTASDLTFTAKVKKSKTGSKVAARAWVIKTQKFDKPIRKAPKGVLTTKKPTKCS